MKQTILKYIFAVTVLSSAVSCSKYLEVTPKQSIDAATALENDEDLNALIIGGYSILGRGSMYGTNFLMLPELMGGDDICTWRGTFTSFREVYNKRMATINEEARRTWVSAYDGINTANLALANLDKIKDADLKTQIEGEAYFMRGILHFELVRYYAQQYVAATAATDKGIVIKTTPTNDETDAFEVLPRNTVAQVYTQVINDLTKATTLLPEENDYRASKYTAYAFLSRVYLQQGDYAKARDAASAVIESGLYVPNASVSAVFSNKNTKESIFEIQQTDQNNAGTANDGMATFYASLPGIGRADVRVNAALPNDLYQASDLRKSEWYYIGTGARAGNTYCGKWKSFSQNLPVIRIPEMYLTRAEANRRLNTNIGATPAQDLAMVVNAVRTNTTAPSNPTLDDILKERTRELLFEGLRIHDLKRLRLPTGDYEWNDNSLVFPIPQREVDATKGVISQNPGY